MRLLWEHTCIEKRRHDADSGMVCDDRGPVGAA
jgi:hypothetical protein